MESTTGLVRLRVGVGGNGSAAPRAWHSKKKRLDRVTGRALTLLTLGPIRIDEALPIVSEHKYSFWAPRPGDAVGVLFPEDT